MAFLSSRLRRSRPGWRLLAALLAAAAQRVGAHGEDQLLMDALTEEIAKAPEADLFIRRGELFRHHAEWAKAESDFAAAVRLDPELVLVDFLRARLWLEAGEPGKAQPWIERYVARQPDEVEAWLLRGDILAAVGDATAGAASYDEGIRRAKTARPEYFIRHAKFLAAMPNADVARVLAAIDAGIARVGPVLSLVDYAITLELGRENYGAALTRITAALQQSARRESWLVRQGEVLTKLGRTGEAAAAYRGALAALEQLPAATRQTMPIEKLERDARGALERLRTP